MSITKKRNKRALWLASSLLVLTLAAVGCGGNASHSNNVQSSGSSDKDTGTGNNAGSGSTNSGSGSTDSGSAPADSAKPDTNEPKEQDGGSGATDSNGAETKKGEGLYVGQVDTHSVEIDTAQGSNVFQYDDNLANQINAIDDNVSVAYEYIEKEIDNGGKKTTQLWLTRIEAVKTA